jgi:hypothetical protein
MNVPEIPWTQIGAFGGFTLLVLALVLWFVLKLRKPKNTLGGTINRQKCINDPRAQACITDLAMSRESMTEMKGDMKVLREKAVEQTTILNNIHDQGKDQTKVLERIATNIGRR